MATVAVPTVRRSSDRLLLAGAAVMLTVRCVRRRAVLPAVLSGTAALVLLLPVSPDHMSIQIAVNGLVAFSWTTVLALSLRRAARPDVP
ncbi:hypothetical protein GCM10027290_64000 [Micromonospora sonneratiae]|uniref:MYXO-CTERM domain-containing protein n=1 Tax=Micromonospora sonneratiae TaxID=1184706 RepID=A0ABW3YGK2_9ACTN